MLVLTHASLARIDELFQYKDNGFELAPFPGYTNDQWGIKAHNRPWIIDVGRFRQGQSVIEVGGGFSLLVEHLAKEFELESWIGDSFGMYSNESIWHRWGDPHKLPNKHPMIRYVFEDFGKFSQSYPNNYFDRIFSVSTLEHIQYNERINVLKDIHRCLKLKGAEIHTIDIPIMSTRRILLSSVANVIPHLRNLRSLYPNGIRDWINAFARSGVKIRASIPSPIELLDRRILIDSPEVVYRFYPPVNSLKPFNASASLLLIIKET